MVERVTEEEQGEKLGSVTDLASVNLRSISARVKLNTTSCSKLLQTLFYYDFLSLRLKNISIKLSDHFSFSQDKPPSTHTLILQMLASVLMVILS